jgi:hypothetical protein
MRIYKIDEADDDTTLPGSLCVCHCCWLLVVCSVRCHNIVVDCLPLLSVIHCERLPSVVCWWSVVDCRLGCSDFYFFSHFEV